MAPKKTLVPLAGTERVLRAGSKLIGPSDPRELVEITLRVRSRSSRATAFNKFASVPPLKRTYMTRAAFAAAHGASSADLAKVRNFARATKLKVVSTSAAERIICWTCCMVSLRKSAWWDW